MKRTLSTLAALTVGATLVITALVATGSSAHSKGAASAGSAAYGRYVHGRAPAARPSRTASSAIAVRRTSLGRTIVDAQGRTLYLFEADRHNVSNLAPAGFRVWPALSANTKPQARAGAKAAKVGTIAGRGGTRQVTYAGHPLYYYVGDSKPSDTNGEALNQFGAEWYVLSPAGRKIDND